MKLVAMTSICRLIARSTKKLQFSVRHLSLKHLSFDRCAFESVSNFHWFAPPFFTDFVEEMGLSFGLSLQKSYP